MIPVELKMLALASILALAQIYLAATPRALRSGAAWAAGSRDEPAAEVPLWAQRADRAARNMLETFPVFAALAAGVVAAGASDGVSAAGSVIYLVARVLYVPAYIFPIYMLRSLIYFAAIFGILMVGWPLLAGPMS